MKNHLKQTAIAVSLALVSSGCFRGGGRLFTAMAIMTTAIVISQRPPPPRYIESPPEQRPGFEWQPGYWTLEEGEWEWVPGRWIHGYPGYRWDAAHWEEDPGGDWRLVPGRWVSTRGQPPPPPPPP